MLERKSLTCPKENGLFENFANGLSANPITKNYGVYVKVIIRAANELFGPEARISKQGSTKQRTNLTDSDLDLLLEGVEVSVRARKIFCQLLEKQPEFRRSTFKTKTNAISICNPEIDICFSKTTWLSKRYPGGDFFKDKPDAQQAMKALKCWNKHHKKKVEGFVFSSLVQRIYPQVVRMKSGMLIFVKVMEFLAFASDMERSEAFYGFDDKKVSPLKPHAADMMRQFNKRPRAGFVVESDIGLWLKEEYKPSFYDECKQCDIKFNSKAQFEQHLNEKKHKTKVTPTVPKETCDVCDVVYDSQSVKHAHLKSKPHKNKNQNVDGCALCGITYVSVTKQDHLNSKKHRNKVFNSRREGCKLCGVEYNSPNEKRAHIASKKHQNRSRY